MVVGCRAFGAASLDAQLASRKHRVRLMMFAATAHPDRYRGADRDEQGSTRGCPNNGRLHTAGLRGSRCSLRGVAGSQGADLPSGVDLMAAGESRSAAFRGVDDRASRLWGPLQGRHLGSEIIDPRLNLDGEVVARCTREEAPSCEQVQRGGGSGERG